MPFDNPLRSLLDTLNAVTKTYNQKEQDQAAQAQMRKSTPSPMMGQQGPAMDQNNMAPAASLAAPWHPQQTPEYGALQQQIEAPGETGRETQGYESKQAFDARQGPNYSGDAVEGKQLSPVDFIVPGLGGVRALGAPIRAAERAAEREAAPAMELSAEALRQNFKEPVAKTLDRLGATKIWERPAAKATARAAQIQNALRDALEAAAKHIQESEAKTGVGKLGVQDGTTQIMKLLETLKGK